MEIREIQERLYPQLITDPEVNERITRVREAFEALLRDVNEKVPSGREQSLAFTHIEEASFWAVKGIARNQDGN